MNVFDYKEFMELCKKLDTEACIEDVTLVCENGGYFNKLKNSVQKDRRGEVAFCVLRRSGEIISVTCNEYPEGIYRIPTGGICYGEDILDAVFRETREELGLEAAIERFWGVLRIRLGYRGESLMFYSYIFILRETGGRLLEDASDDEISGVKEVGLEQLNAMADSLNNIAGNWRDWGRFRYLTTKAVCKALSDFFTYSPE